MRWLLIYVKDNYMGYLIAFIILLVFSLICWFIYSSEKYLKKIYEYFTRVKYIRDNELFIKKVKNGYYIKYPEKITLDENKVVSVLQEYVIEDVNGEKATMVDLLNYMKDHFRVKGTDEISVTTYEDEDDNPIEQPTTIQLDKFINN